MVQGLHFFLAPLINSMRDLFSAFTSRDVSGAIKRRDDVLLCVRWLPPLQYQTAHFKILRDRANYEDKF